METARPSVLFYLIDYNVILVCCCTSKPTNQQNKRQKIYIYMKCVCTYIYIYIYMCTHTLELMMQMALEKGYIFPLKLKINKMVSNISLVTRFNTFF